MKRNFWVVWVWFASLAMATSVNAVVFDFDNPDLSGWYRDRYVPNVFETAEFDGDERLRIGISGDDQQSSSFYNYQGMKHDFGDDVLNYSIVGDLFVDAAWESGSWNVGMWGTLFDSDGDVSAYPIIAYRNGDNIEAGFYGYDYIGGEWFDVMSVTTFDRWYSLEMAYDNLGLNYRIDGQGVAHFADTYNHAKIGNIILNSYNFGNDYDVYWDNVGTQNPVPEPGTFLLLGLGLLGGAAYRRKLKIKK